MKRILSLALSAALALALAGCGASSGKTAASSYAVAEMAPEAPPMSTEADMSLDMMDSALTELSAAQRKIIYRANLTIETKDYASTCTALRQAAAEAGGYLESTREHGSAEYGSRGASFCFRIPSASYSSFLGRADETGSVVYRSESTEDITAQYVDVEARLSSLEAQKAKLEELRAQAESLEDLLTIEERISDVQYQLESYTSQRRLYDNQVDYCTVDISVEEVAVYTPANSFGSRVQSALGDALDSFVAFLQEVVIFCIYALPYLILLAVLLALFLLLRKKLPRRQPRQPKGKNPDPDYSTLYPQTERKEPEQDK